MNVGHITYRYKPLIGGAETYLAALLTVLKEAGFRQRVYQVRNEADDPLIVPVSPGPAWLPKLVGFNVGLLGQKGRLTGEDLLIVNYPEHFFPVWWHKRAIVLSHGATWTHEENRLRRTLRKRAAHFAYKHAPFMVANDTYFYREMGLDIRPMQNTFAEVAPGKWFIPNCVDTAFFQKKDPRPDLCCLKGILVPRNFSYPRGVDLAVRAFALFNKKHPETSLLLAGDEIKDNAGSVAYKKELVSLVESLALGDKIRFLGNIPWREMPEVYSSVEMTLIPTRSSEGTSLSALESMACGVATLSTEVEGLCDLPTHKCKPEVEDMARAMEEVYLRRHELADKQCAVVRQTYNLQNWAEAWLKVIKQAAGRGR